MDLSEARERHLQFLKIKQYALSTRRTFEKRLLRFFEYLILEGIVDVREIRKAHLLTYKRAMQGGFPPFPKPLSPGSVAAYVTTVRNFFQFLEEEREIFQNPAFGVRIPHSKAIAQVVLSESEIELLLSQPDLLSLTGIRNRAILELFYSTGIRLGELHRLNLEDLDLAEAVLWIRKGKGGKDRVVPVGNVALEWMGTYFRQVRPKLAIQSSENAVFLSAFYGRRLDHTRCSYMVSKYAKQAGLRKPVSAHTLRRTCASHLLSGGADVRYVQELLGHRSLSTTQVYLHWTLQQLKVAHHRFHPRERKRN